MAKYMLKPEKHPATVSGRTAQGFTLVEIIIGIVILGIALTFLSTLLFPQAQRGAEPVLQMRAAELGIALMSEITSQSFDENSDHSGGALRCDEDDAPACTPFALFGPDGSETRGTFNDVDDYHRLEESFPNLSNALGESLASRYPGFSYSIDVCYSDAQGACIPGDTPAERLFKRIEITIVTPQGQPFSFSSLRGNF
ncbi:MAG: prepilin-type N-terminal cleavage/methylation domain-containing protein [Idiomarina sp.]|nr:prepilin-type N-terminal cleavage/methylation domain-containing protein [Idiomarina sp.]